VHRCAFDAQRAAGLQRRRCQLAGPLDAAKIGKRLCRHLPGRWLAQHVFGQAQLQLRTGECHARPVQAADAGVDASGCEPHRLADAADAAAVARTLVAQAQLAATPLQHNRPCFEVPCDP